MQISEHNATKLFEIFKCCQDIDVEISDSNEHNRRRMRPYFRRVSRCHHLTLTYVLSTIFEDNNIDDNYKRVICNLQDILYVYRFENFTSLIHHAMSILDYTDRDSTRNVLNDYFGKDLYLDIDTIANDASELFEKPCVENNDYDKISDLLKRIREIYSYLLEKRQLIFLVNDINKEFYSYCRNREKYNKRILNDVCPDYVSDLKEAEKLIESVTTSEYTYSIDRYKQIEKELNDIYNKLYKDQDKLNDLQEEEEKEEEERKRNIDSRDKKNKWFNVLISIGLFIMGYLINHFGIIGKVISFFKSLSS